MPTLKELERWMITSQVAERLGLSRQRVVKLAQQGRCGRAVKVGGVQWIFDPASIDKLQASRASQKPSERARGGDAPTRTRLATSPDEGGPGMENHPPEAKPERSKA